MRTVKVYTVLLFFIEVVNVSDLDPVDDPFSDDDSKKIELGHLDNQWLGCSVAAVENGPIVVSGLLIVYH